MNEWDEVGLKFIKLPINESKLFRVVRMIGSRIDDTLVNRP